MSYVVIDVHIKHVTLSKCKWSWKDNTHKDVLIETWEGGKIDAIIHNSICEMIVVGNIYTLECGRTDRTYDRFLEILNVNLIKENRKEKAIDRVRKIVVKGENAIE